MSASMLRAKRNVLESLGKIYLLHSGCFLFKEGTQDFFYSLHDPFFPHNFIGNNNLFNCKLFLYGLSFYFLLNNSENEQ